MLDAAQCTKPNQGQMKAVAEMYAKPLEQLQHIIWLNPKSITYKLNYYSIFSLMKTKFITLAKPPNLE
jgi:hypothetical protein